MALADGRWYLDDLGAYQAAALSTRDNLLINWNDTQLNYTRKNPKRAYYLSLEFLMGRTLDNAVRPGSDIALKPADINILSFLFAALESGPQGSIQGRSSEAWIQH